jgi:hypothetical protein
MARRTRTSITVRKDNSVPGRRRNKSPDVIVIVIVLILLILFVISRTRQLSSPGHAPRAESSVPTR